MKLLLFPHQLFDPSYLKTVLSKERTPSQIHLIEHTLFYGARKFKYVSGNSGTTSPKASPMKFNKRKLVFHRASMLAYIDECKKVGLPPIRFHENISSLKACKSILTSSKANVSLASLASLDIMYFDPVDHELQHELNQTFPCAIRMETPYFLFTSAQLMDYLGMETKKSPPSSLTHSAFYTHSLKVHKVPYITKSHDKENRHAFKADNVPPMDIPTYSGKYIQKAIAWVERMYPSHYGSTDTMWLPVERKDARASLKSFLKTHVKTFGKYQDAMVIQRPFLHHSRLSALLNNGLLTPQEVLDETVAYYKKHRTSIPLASFEGFIRQLVGWREYQRLLYISLYTEMVTSNHFHNQGRLSNVWYPMDKPREYLTPLNDAIDQAWEYGYLHHIYRLMVVANGMNLMGVHPYEAYRWFMEFAVDSYDWVMIGNVYSMGMWADGGKTMRKPYLSSNAYIENMSIGYTEDDTWGSYWKSLFYVFLKKNEPAIRKTIYARNLGAYGKMSAVQKRDMAREAKEAIRYYVKK